MNLKNAIALIAILGTIWGVAYMHDRNHRYDIVAAGAGSGGSQNDSGFAIIRAYVIDHKTGNVALIQGSDSAPVVRKGW
jgi:hypothetical protein